DGPVGGAQEGGDYQRVGLCIEGGVPGGHAKDLAIEAGAYEGGAVSEIEDAPGGGHIGELDALGRGAHGDLAVGADGDVVEDPGGQVLRAVEHKGVGA